MSTAKLLYSHPFFSGKTGVPLEKVSLIPCLGSKLLKNYQIPPKNSAKISVKQTLNNEFVRESPARSSCCSWRNFELKHFHHIRIPMITTSCIQMFQPRLWIVREMFINEYVCLSDMQVCLPSDLKEDDRFTSVVPKNVLLKASKQLM